MLKLSSVLGNSQRLDGGAMFGNAPRALWSQWCPPDELGRVALSCRAFLVEDGEQRVLLETGIGTFFEPALRERYGVQEAEHVLVASLGELGLEPADIDVVVLSHLHFDHAGGLLCAYRADEPQRLLFPRSRFLVTEVAWQRAREPHLRDRASFIPGLQDLLEASGRLEIVKDASEVTAALGPRFRGSQTFGHTPGMLHVELLGERANAVFCADLVPGTPWVHLPITMGYDRYPEQLIDEKADLFARLEREQSWLLFTHDVQVAASQIARDAKGRFTPRAAQRHLVGWDLDATSAPVT